MYAACMRWEVTAGVHNVQPWAGDEFSVSSVSAGRQWCLLSLYHWGEHLASPASQSLALQHLGPHPLLP